VDAVTPQDLAAHVQRGREYIERSRVDRRALPADETTRLVNIITADRDKWKAAAGKLTSRVIALEIEVYRLRRVASDALRLVDDADPMRAQNGDGV
jgi:hypothetical protein